MILFYFRLTLNKDMTDGEIISLLSKVISKWGELLNQDDSLVSFWGIVDFVKSWRIDKALMRDGRDRFTIPLESLYLENDIFDWLKEVQKEKFTITEDQWKTINDVTLIYFLHRVT